MEKHSIIGDFWFFLRKQKLWWLLPLVFLVVTLALIIALVEPEAVAPMLYPNS